MIQQSEINANKERIRRNMLQARQTIEDFLICFDTIYNAIDNVNTVEDAKAFDEKYRDILEPFQHLINNA